MQSGMNEAGMLETYAGRNGNKVKNKEGPLLRKKKRGQRVRGLGGERKRSRAIHPSAGSRMKSDVPRKNQGDLKMGGEGGGVCIGHEEGNTARGLKVSRGGGGIIDEEH